MKNVVVYAVCLSFAAQAQIPNVFKPNDPARSAEINQNFKYLDSVLALKANKARLETAIVTFANTASREELKALQDKIFADSLNLSRLLQANARDLDSAEASLKTLTLKTGSKSDTSALTKVQNDLDSVRVRSDYTYLKIATIYNGDFNTLVAHPKSSAIGLAAVSANTPFPLNSSGGDWYNFLNIRHFNGFENDGKVHGGQLAWGRSVYRDRLAFRSQSDGVWNPWTEVFTNKNLTAQNLPGGPYMKQTTALSVDTAGVVHVAALQVHTDLATPDYVFEPDYKLSTLAEVEAFTKENKHLPEVPSAAQIEKGGLDLAQMNLALLRKVEELTLHAISQEKRIQALETEIKTLR